MSRARSASTSCYRIRSGSAVKTSCWCSSGSSSSPGRFITRVVTNRRLVRNRARIGRFCTLLGFGALLGGLVYSSFGIGSQDSRTIFISYTALIAGYILISVGKNNWLRFSLHPRPDEALAANLKTLDVRTVLFNYVSSLPVDHLISSPGGMVVIETRPFVGDIEVRGDRWSRKRGISAWLQFFSEGALGNPTRDAQRGVESVKRFLAERLGSDDAGQVPIEPMVVFTNPRVRLTVDNPTIAIAPARDLRGEVKRLTTGTKMPSELARRIEALLIEEARPYGEPVSAGEAVERKERRRRKPARAR